MEVQYPFQTGCKVVRITIAFFVAVNVNPFYTVTNVEFPGNTAIFTSPLVSNCRNQFTIWISFQKTIEQLCQVFKVFSSLRLKNVESFQLTACQNTKNQIFNLFFRTCFCSSFAFCRSSIAFCACSFFGAGRSASTATTTQNKRSCHCDSKQSG